MPLLLFAHGAAIAVWFGSAAFDVLLEVGLVFVRSPDTQRRWILRHRAIDRWLEGPAILVALLSGLALLWSAGWLGPGQPWPGWLAAKVTCGLGAAVGNGLCVVFVLARGRATELAPHRVAPRDRPEVRRWNGPIWWTGVAIPPAIVALALGLAYG